MTEENPRLRGLLRCILAAAMLVSGLAAPIAPVAAELDTSRAEAVDEPLLDGVGHESEPVAYVVTLDDAAVETELQTSGLREPSATPGRATPGSVDPGSVDPAEIDPAELKTAAVDSVIDQVLATTSPIPADTTHRYHEVLNGFAAELTAAEVAVLRSDPRVAAVERDRPMRLFGDQADPVWGLDRIDETAPVDDDQYHWDFDGAGVHLYVLDTGIRLDHEEFVGRLGLGTDVADEDDDPTDCSGHGTHVSSTAGGTTWGVAKAVTIHPVRVFKCGGSTPTAVVIAGLEWIAENHVKPAVVNMSLGGEGSASADSAVQALTDLGVVVVAAAGNDASDACRATPASEGSVITVGATTQNDALAGFSNWGTCVDLLAPGESVTAAGIASPSADRILNGTSMAAPHVAGAAALVLSEHPTATPQQVMDLLVEASTRDVISELVPGTPNRFLHTLGINDVLPPSLEVQPNFVSAVGSSVSGGLEISGPGSEGAVFVAQGLPAGVSLSADGDISGAPVALGRFDVEITVSAAGREYYRRFQWQVAPTSNSAPAIQEFANDVTVLAGSNPRFWFHVNDPDVDFAGIDFFDPSGDLVFTNRGFGSTPEARRFQLLDVPEGEHEILAEAYDYRGQLSTVETFRITAVPSLGGIPNPDPELAPLARVNAVLNEPVSFQLAAVGADPNVRFGSSPLPPGLVLNTVTGQVTGTPQAIGDFEVRATIGNLQGSTASQRITVRVTLVDPTELEPTASVRTSCVASDGRIDVDLDNPSLSTVTFSVSVGGQPDAVISVAPESNDTRRYSDLDDSAYLIGVNVDGQPIFSGREIIACDPPPPEAVATSTCLSGDGRIDIEVTNVLEDFAVFRATFDDRLPRSTGLAPGSMSRLTITGRRDGPIDVRVTRNEELVFAETITVACDVVEPIEIVVGCLAGNGRIDVHLRNQTQAAVDYTVTVGALSPRSRNVAGGAIGRVTVTGRPDGPYDVRVASTGPAYAETVEVDCDPDAPVDPTGQEVAVRLSCLAENGRVDVFLDNTTGATSTYAVAVGQLSPRVRTIGPNGAVRVTVTGRQDGPLLVLVSRDGAEIRREQLTVACDG